MSSGPSVPEDSFRAVGHCCAITLPGLKEAGEAVRFDAADTVRVWLAKTYGMETRSASATENEKPAGESSPAGPDDTGTA